MSSYFKVMTPYENVQLEKENTIYGVKTEVNGHK